MSTKASRATYLKNSEQFLRSRINRYDRIQIHREINYETSTREEKEGTGRWMDSPSEVNLNLLILGSVAVVQARVKAGMMLSLSSNVFGRDKLDDPSSSGTAARLTALSSPLLTSMAKRTHPP